MNDTVVVAGAAVVLAALGFLFAGPLGALVVGVVVVAVGLAVGSQPGTQHSARNCPACGSVVDGDTCGYCGATLEPETRKN